MVPITKDEADTRYIQVFVYKYLCINITFKNFIFFVNKIKASRDNVKRIEKQVQLLKLKRDCMYEHIFVCIKVFVKQGGQEWHCLNTRMPS